MLRKAMRKIMLAYSNPQKALRDHVDEEDRTANESFTV